MTAGTDAAPLQVLVVEDDLGDLALMESSFADNGVGAELHHVADGVDALAFLRREADYGGAPRPDLILLDLNMPRMDGRQLLGVIKEDADLKTIPVVVFTTSATPDDIAASYSAHANAYVAKPIDLDDFARVVTAIHGFYGHVVTLPSRVSDGSRHDGPTD